MKKSLHIDFLDRHEDCVETVAAWHHEEWVKGQAAEESLDDKALHLRKRIATLKQHMENRSIPVTFVAMVEGEPVGSSSVVQYQFTPNQKSSEWLTNIYVKPEYRNHGLARKLIDHACNYAEQVGVETLQLYTKDKATFYQNLGWEYSGSGIVQGEEVDVFRKRLCARVAQSV